MEPKEYRKAIDNLWADIMGDKDPRSVQAEIERKIQEETSGIFLVRTAGQCLQESRIQPIPRMLFSEFWHEGELCILFADTNLGKSILAVQIGDSISRGTAIPGFLLHAEAQPVLYFDFELSEKQFEARYSSEYERHYTFHPNFYRATISPYAYRHFDDGSFEDLVNSSIESSLIKTGARVLIIDNLTYLRSETEKARDALPLMKHLKALKQTYDLSILALAHTPKRDQTKPITRNDLQGSKMLINFCDSAFAIGESSANKDLRYLKQVKQRYTAAIYDAANVCLCHTVKPDNFLQFEFADHGREWEHLRSGVEEDRDKLKEQLKEQVKELHLAGNSQRDIARITRLPLSSVNRYLRA